MAPTKSTRLTSLFRKIHPPLSLSPRESQQLAQSLSQSFQDHLDKEHPAAATRTGNHSEMHISSILRNPHFNITKTASSANLPRPRSSSTGSTPSAIEQLQTFVLDRSLFSFRQQVAAGEASLESAKECLRLYKGNRTNISPSSPGVSAAFIGVEQDQVGLTIANWLWSSGLEETMEFMYDTDFIALLVPRLYDEGQSERVERWVEKTKASVGRFTNTILYDERLVEAASSLVKNLIISVEKARGLNDALCLFHKIVSNTRFGIEVERRIYGPTARRLSQILMSLPTKEIDTSLYEGFALDLPRCLRGAHLKQRLAWMSLKHPQHPDPDPALDFIRSYHVPTFQDLSKMRRVAAIRSHIEVAEALLVHERTNEAWEVMNILARSFPSETPTNQKTADPAPPTTDIANAIQYWSSSLATA